MGGAGEWGLRMLGRSCEVVRIMAVVCGLQTLLASTLMVLYCSSRSCTVRCLISENGGSLADQTFPWRGAVSCHNMSRDRLHRRTKVQLARLGSETTCCGFQTLSYRLFTYSCCHNTGVVTHGRPISGQLGSRQEKGQKPAQIEITITIG